jgi:indole-3-glycerol phosphate synthase/phosphoribosylanthranilate isomerase
MIVAGGITPENAFAASSLGVYAIDVNSGVERAGSPGAKDGEKIDRLFDNLRAASRKEG